MNMFRHHDEGVQAVTGFAPIPIESFQKESDIEFDGEQFSAMEGREGYEVSSRQREKSSRLQEQTSAAESRIPFQTVNWHEWNSCPSRLLFV